MNRPERKKFNHNIFECAHTVFEKLWAFAVRRKEINLVYFIFFLLLLLLHHERKTCALNWMEKCRRETPSRKTTKRRRNECRTRQILAGPHARNSGLCLTSDDIETVAEVFFKSLTVATLRKFHHQFTAAIDLELCVMGVGCWLVNDGVQFSQCFHKFALVCHFN